MSWWHLVAHKTYEVETLLFQLCAHACLIFFFFFFASVIRQIQEKKTPTDVLV
jgi:hypothetical protein